MAANPRARTGLAIPQPPIDRHRARRLDEPRLADPVLELLAPHGVTDDLLQLGVGGAVSDRAPQVGLVEREQARAQAAVGGEPDPVAVAAERLRDRVDEADLPVAVGEPVDAGGGARLARLGLERVHRADQVADLGAGQHLVGRPRMVGVERHELDEPHLVRGTPRESGERQHLLLGEVADRDRVDLDRVRLGVRGQRLEPAQDLGEGVAPGELEEAVVLQRVDRDVEAVDPRLDEGGRIALEQEPVGGHRQVLDPVDRRQHRDKPGEAPAHERLAPGQAHVGDTHLRQQRHDPGDLLEAEDLLAREPRQPLGRHAVLAAEVAAIGDRHPQVADRPAMPVAEWFEGHAQRLPCRRCVHRPASSW